MAEGKREMEAALALTRSSGRLRIETLASALKMIRDSHLGDCPAGMDRLSQAEDHIFRLRKIALNALIEEGLD